MRNLQVLPTIWNRPSWKANTFSDSRNFPLFFNLYGYFWTVCSQSPILHQTNPSYVLPHISL